jgi:hypothetical protein
LGRRVEFTEAGILSATGIHGYMEEVVPVEIRLGPSNFAGELNVLGLLMSQPLAKIPALFEED